MPVIKPISDLRNKANKISELAHKSDEPIFITKNGEGDMVVMSMAQYGKLQLKLDLFSELAVAQSQRARGDKGRTLAQVMKDLRKAHPGVGLGIPYDCFGLRKRSDGNSYLHLCRPTFRCRIILNEN